eukprot:scaffold258666_cov22-Tisochrysis_lutea.AAC.2
MTPFRGRIGCIDNCGPRHVLQNRFFGLPIRLSRPMDSLAFQGKRPLFCAHSRCLRLSGCC